MTPPVFVLGGFQSDFAQNLARARLGLAELTKEVVEGALASSAVDAEDVDAVHVGNAFGELFTGQAQLGAMPATVVPALANVPASRHEAACASGSIAVLSAMRDIEAGHAQCVLVVGVEQQRNVPGEIAARHLGAAAWVGREGQDARYMWPHLFSRVADEVAERYGLQHAHLAAIAKKNFGNAKRNPLAQTRGWAFTDASFTEDDEANPLVEGRLRRQDCGQVTDGGAAIVLASAEFADAWAKKHSRPIGKMARFAGWGHRTAGLGLEEKLQQSKGAGYMFPHLRATITDAYRRASIVGPGDLDGIETHDCFTITEYVAIDHLGITAPGRSFEAIEDGRLEHGAALPVNASGGLIGLGHPVGATGVRMVHDAVRQVTGSAGEMQIEGAKRIATLNIGGSFTTAVSFVVATET